MPNPLSPDRWLSLVAGSAAGALVLAGFVGGRTRSAWTMTIGLELLVLGLVGAGLAPGQYRRRARTPAACPSAGFPAAAALAAVGH